MPRNTASYTASSSSKGTSAPTSHLRRNSTPMPSMISRRFSTTSFSSLKGGIPKVSRPPMRGWRSNTGLHAVAHQDVGAGEPRGTGSHDRHALIRRAHMRHVGLPAALQGLVGDVFLDRADGDGAQSVVQRAGALAQAVLRADAPAHLGERVGFVRELGRLEEIALLDELEPVGDVVMDRAFPFAEGIAAGEAPPGLTRRALRIEGRIDLAEVPHARLHCGLGRLRPRHVEELKVLVRHPQAARRRFSISESMEAAFGFTTQNFGR